MYYESFFSNGSPNQLKEFADSVRLIWLSIGYLKKNEGMFHTLFTANFQNWHYLDQLVMRYKICVFTPGGTSVLIKPLRLPFLITSMTSNIPHIQRRHDFGQGVTTTLMIAGVQKTMISG